MTSEELWKDLHAAGLDERLIHVHMRDFEEVRAANQKIMIAREVIERMELVVGRIKNRCQHPLFNVLGWCVVCGEGESDYDYPTNREGDRRG